VKVVPYSLSCSNVEYALSKHSVCPLTTVVPPVGLVVLPYALPQAVVKPGSAGLLTGEKPAG
jgi:hypothetical protein